MSSAGHLSELDLLRGQVADLSRELAERDRALREQSLHMDREKQDVREQYDMLRAIVEGTAAETGEEFFAALVTHLTSVLKVQYAVIGEVLEGRLKKIRTLAVSAGGTLADNFEYELAHTPCATALTQTFACFDRDVQATFPQFQHLADLGAESYCGVSLRTKGGAVIGLLVVMDTKPLQHGDYLQSLLGVFAPHVAAEFERKRVEHERAQTLADLKNVIETVPDMMFTLDTHGNMVKWNRRVGEVTGYSPEELLGMPALAFVPLEEQTRTATAIQQAFMNGYAELEGHLLTKDRRTTPYYWIGAALKDPDGRIIGITGVGRDVSEKKQAEENLKQHQRHLVDAQALAHLGSWDWDIDTGEVQWSDEQFRIFGHEPRAGTVTYDTFLAALLPEDHDRVLAAINDALLGKRPYDVEYRIVRPNGEVRFIHSRGDVHRDTTGHPLSMTGTILDVTERKQTEEALRASEERWQLAVCGSNDGIWDWDIRTGEVFFSMRWKAMRGFEDHEITSHVDEWRSRIHPDDLDRVLQSIDAYLAKQIPEFFEEYRVQQKDGSYMWVLDRGIALWADDGTPLRMAGSETDITERKRAEEALREMNLALANAMPGIARLDSQGRYLAMNEMYASALGFDPSELTGGDWSPTVSPGDRPKAEAAYATMLREGKGEFEAVALRKDGSTFWKHVLMVKILDLEGRHLGHHCFMRDITARKQTEEALRLAKFSMDRAADAVYWIDAQARVLDVNEAASLMLGYSKEELCAMTVYDLNPDFPADMWRGVWAETKRRGTMVIETAHRAKNGRLIPIEVSVNYLSYEGKEYHCAFVRDITVRKKAEAALRESEAHFRSMADTAPVLIWMSGLDKLCSYFNQVWLDYTGRTLEQELGNGWANGVHPEDFDRCLKTYGQAFDRREPFQMEYRLRQADGQYGWLLVKGVPRQLPSGKFAGYIGSCIDITDRKRAEQALRLTQFAVDRGADMALWIDRSARVLYVNDAACQRLGYSRDELLAMTIPDLDPDYQLDLWSQHWNELKEQKRLRFESRHRTKSGEIYPIEIVANYVVFEGQEYNFAFCRDMTDRKRAEEVLRQRERLLHTVIEERERISQDLHDGILQSLFAVGLALEASKSMMSPRARKSFGASLDQAINQLNRVMREIRNFTAGLGSDPLQGKDLPMALQNMLASLTVNQATRVRLAVEDRAAKAVSAEQSLHLLLVIQEAVNNCIRHGRAQEAKVSLKMLKQGVRLSIRDNGRGFNPDTAKGAGHGLGNMAARAQKIGGRFTVLSKVNEGTRVVLDLPKEAADVLR